MVLGESGRRERRGRGGGGGGGEKMYKDWKGRDIRGGGGLNRECGCLLWAVLISNRGSSYFSFWLT